MNNNKIKPGKLTLKLDASKKQELENLFKPLSKQIIDVGQVDAEKKVKSKATLKEVKNVKIDKKPKEKTKTKTELPVTVEVMESKKDVPKGSEESEESNKEVASVKKKTHHIIEPVDYMAIIKHLQTNYPSCFSSKEVKPLAIGIREELLSKELPFSITKIKKFLTAFTRTKKYKKSLIIGVSRVNLLGEETSKVLEEETKNSGPSAKKEESKA